MQWFGNDPGYNYVIFSPCICISVCICVHVPNTYLFTHTTRKQQNSMCSLKQHSHMLGIICFLRNFACWTASLKTSFVESNIYSFIIEMSVQVIVFINVHIALQIKKKLKEYTHAMQFHWRIRCIACSGADVFPLSYQFHQGPQINFRVPFTFIVKLSECVRDPQRSLVPASIL